MNMKEWNAKGDMMTRDLAIFVRTGLNTCDINRSPAEQFRWAKIANDVRQLLEDKANGELI